VTDEENGTLEAPFLKRKLEMQFSVHMLKVHLDPMGFLFSSIKLSGILLRVTS